MVFPQALPEVYRKSRGLPVTGHKGCVEWTGIVVKRLLSNEYYTGDSVHGKTKGMDKSVPLRKESNTSLTEINRTSRNGNTRSI